MNYEIEMHRDNFKLIFVFVSFITQQRSIGENNSYTEHNDINMIKFIHQPVIEKKRKKTIYTKHQNTIFCTKKVRGLHAVTTSNGGYNFL